MVSRWSQLQQLQTGYNGEHYLSVGSDTKDKSSHRMQLISSCGAAIYDYNEPARKIKRNMSFVDKEKDQQLQY